MDELVTVKVQLTRHTHGQFKSACALANQSIKDALIELIHYYIDNPMTKKEDEQRKD